MVKIDNYFLADSKRSFWMAYVVNILIVTSFAAQMQFGNYIISLGGSPVMGSTILSIGVLSAIFYKIYLSKMFGHLSLKNIWMLSISMMFMGSLIFAFQNTLGVSLYFARAAFVCGYGGSAACSIIYILRLTEKRFRTQVLSFYSTSHFVGLFIGPILSDMLLVNYGYEAIFFHNLFLYITFSSVLGLLLVAFMPNMYFDQRDVSKNQLPFDLLKTVNKSAAGLLFLGALSLGLAFTIPQFYLAMYAKSIGVQSISSFFASYTITGFCVRMFFSSIHYERNRSQLLALGFGCFAASQLLLLAPVPIFGFIAAGIIGGIARSVIEPSLLTLGADILPVKNRDFGTTLVLIAMDIGMVISAPALGLIAKQSYVLMFVSTSVLFTAVCLTLFVRKNQITYASTSEEEKKIDAEWSASNRTNVLISGKLHPYAMQKLFDNNNVLVKYIPYASLFELKSYVAKAHVLVCDHTTEITNRLLSRAPDLRLVSSSSLSLNHIDLDVCESQKVEVVNLPVRRADVVADMALGTLVGVVQQKMFKSVDMDLDKNISSKKMAIWGRGTLTKELVYQAEKVGIASVVLEDMAHFEAGNQMSSFDVFVVTEPLTINSYNSIGIKNLSNLREDVIIINLSKTDVVKHEDIASFLKKRPEACYICDILDEPLSNKDNWLLNHDRVFCTPHINGVSKESFFDIGEAVVSSIEDLYERRDNSRIDIAPENVIGLTLYRGKNETEIAVEVSDLSLNGIGVISSVSFDQGERLQLRFNENSENTQDRKINLFVKRVFRHGTGQYRVGLLTTDLNINLIESVKDLLSLSTEANFDRRQNSRTLLQRRAILQTPDESFPIEVLDQSSEGLGFRTTRILSPGTRVSLQDGSTVCGAEITWRSSLAGGMFAYGSSFISSSPVEKESHLRQAV